MGPEACGIDPVPVTNVQVTLDKKCVLTASDGGIPPHLASQDGVEDTRRVWPCCECVHYVDSGGAPSTHFRHVCTAALPAEGLT